jgi:hypothetical protein
MVSEIGVKVLRNYYHSECGLKPATQTLLSRVISFLRIANIGIFPLDTLSLYNTLLN